MLVALVLLSVLIGFGSTYRAVFYPVIQQPVSSDALLVLGPVDEKMELAVQLVRDGVADTLLISDQYLVDEGSGGCRPEVNYLLEHLGALDASFPAKIICFRPDPVTTQGEALFLRDMGTDLGWSSVTVVSYTPHVERARILLNRCWDGELAVTAVDQPMSTSEAIGTYFYQSGAMVKTLFTPKCDSRLPPWVEEFGWKVSDTEERLDPYAETLNTH